MFQKSDWAIWVEMFEASEFEIYETSVQLNAERQKKN